MSKEFHLTIARVGENLFDGTAKSVTLPGSEGVFTVLAEHEPFISTLVPGEIKFTDAEGSEHMMVVEKPGIAEISKNQATVLL